MLTNLKNTFINSNKFVTPGNLVFSEPINYDFDFATNIAMVISKECKKNPLEVATEIVNHIKSSGINFEKIEISKPGFINFRLSDLEICQDLKNVRKIEDSKKEKIIIDYSSPNIAKKMHIGHLRSTVIGDSIYKILKHFGHDVVGDSHIGDWGTQFGKLIYGYEKWLDKNAYKEDPIKELQRVYVMFHELEDEEALKEARKILVKLQNKEEPYFSLWKEFCEKSLEEYEKTYKYLGIKIDNNLGESFFHSLMKPLVEKLFADKIAVESEGAKVIFFDEETKIPPAIIQKKDGGFLYVTSDIACIDYRVNEWGAKKIIYVVDSRQSNHFKQVFEISKKIGYQTELVHAQFGVMSLGGEKISTREGKSVNLQDLLNKGFEKAKEVVEEKNPKLNEDEKNQIAKSVSVAAVKFFDLSHQKTSDIIFIWEKALSFSGKSAPYIQYAYTRISSLLKKTSKEVVDSNIRVSNQKEREIIKTLFQYGKILDTSYKKLEPHHIANYLFKLTSVFNSWYSEVKILDDEENLNSRLFIIKEVQKTIKEGLGLLGIDVLERM